MTESQNARPRDWSAVVIDLRRMVNDYERMMQLGFTQAARDDAGHIMRLGVEARRIAKS